MSGVVLTFPILAGKVEAWRRFCQELAGSRRRQFEASRQRMGITHEQMVLVETPFGAKAVTRLEALDVAQAVGMLITSDRSFDNWYRERLRELHGVDLAGYEPASQLTPQSWNPEVHFEWSLETDMDVDVDEPKARIG